MSDFTKRKRFNWSDREEKYFKKIFEEKQIAELLQKTAYRKDNVYGIVANELKKLGYNRSIVQIKQKWQNMKRDLKASKPKKEIINNNGILQINNPPSFIHHEPSQRSLEHGIDTFNINNEIIHVKIEKEEEDFTLEQTPIEFPENTNLEKSHLMDPQPHVDRSPPPPISQTIAHQDLHPSPDMSKGKGNADSLSSFHERWVESCDTMWKRQQEFWQEQNERQRQWEEQLWESQKIHDRELIAMSNAALTSAINSLINGRQQPMIMPFPPMPMSPSPERESPISDRESDSPPIQVNAKNQDFFS